MTKTYNGLLLLENSYWPLLMSLTGFSMLLSAVFSFYFKIWNFFFLNFCIILILAFLWWRDVNRESTMQGKHNLLVIYSLKIGMILFIFSEVMLFFSFFWVFLHGSLSPAMEVGMIWPPLGMSPFNPFQVPLLNTMILLSSGVTVTWSHHNLMKNKSVLISLGLTILLGIYFSFLQGMEYSVASFSICDSIYGNIFFMGTGFHGGHVIIGSLFLAVCLFRSLLKYPTMGHHLGFELCIWYWHFVDVIWLFLFSLIYWWGF